MSMTEKNLNPPSAPSKRRNKIAVLVRRFITTGGAERYALEITRRLAREHEVHVFAQEWSYEGDEQISFHKIPKYFERPNFLNQLVFSYFTRKALNSSYDIIHTHERVSHFDVLTIHCPCFRTFITKERRPWRKALIWISVALSPRKLAYLWLEKRQFTYRRGRLLIAVSENVKENVQANYPLPDDYFRLVYPAVDENWGTKAQTNKDSRELRGKLGIREDDLVILFVGTEFKRKGLEALLRGYAMIPRSKTKLLVAGGGDQKDYAGLAKDLGIENDTIFLGLVEDVESVYAISDVYVLPTLSDPAPMAPLEAMACGVATVLSCHEYAGTAEHIKDGEALILKDPKDHREIADCLSRMMSEDFRRELGEKGRQLAKKLTWEKATKETLDVYREILKKR
jgi:glycosyltransferase involved in cell wall biosynthesis